MEVIAFILFLGPLLARILCPTHLNAADALALGLMNAAGVGVWVVAVRGLEFVLDPWAIRLIGIASLIAMQLWLFKYAMQGTRCEGFVSGLLREIVKKRGA
jgi:hypothetical protein